MTEQEPEQDITVVVLDRADKVPIPSYSVFGYTFCVVCAGKVWLGHNTARLMHNDETVHAMCQPCAADTIPPDTKPFQRVKDDACPNCGRYHHPPGPAHD